MPQFMTSIDADDFGKLDLRFIHSRGTGSNPIPLLFLHGWPGSFAEVQKILPLLNDTSFDVVAPSLPGYGFSSYPATTGFKHKHIAEVINKLMLKLGYGEYVVQGGDWGSDIARMIAVMFPKHVKALHQNMLMMAKPDFPAGEPEYSEFEKICLQRFEWFQDTNAAYDSIQSTKPTPLASRCMTPQSQCLLGWLTSFSCGLTSIPGHRLRSSLGPCCITFQVQRQAS